MFANTFVQREVELNLGVLSQTTDHQKQHFQHWTPKEKTFNFPKNCIQLKHRECLEGKNVSNKFTVSENC